MIIFINREKIDSIEFINQCYIEYSRIVNDNPSAIIPSIARGEFGKPYFTMSNVHFSLANSKDIVVLAMSDNPVGVDAEVLRDYSYEKLVARYFDRDTAKCISSVKEFFIEWCKKEAYAKFLGVRLMDTIRTKNEARIIVEIQGIIIAIVGDGEVFITENIVHNENANSYK